MRCKAAATVYIGDTAAKVSCVRDSHGEEVVHRWQESNGNVNAVVEWKDRGRFGLAEQNGLRAIVNQKDANAEEVALGLLGYLANHPEVARLLLADLPKVVG